MTKCRTEGGDDEDGSQHHGSWASSKQQQEPISRIQQIRPFFILLPIPSSLALSLPFTWKSSWTATDLRHPVRRS